MYPLSIYSHTSHSKETLIWARYGGFPARNEYKRKMAHDGHHSFRLCRKLVQRND